MVKTAISSKKRDYYFKHEFAIFNIFTFYNKTHSPSTSTFNARIHTKQKKTSTAKCALSEYYTVNAFGWFEKNRLNLCYVSTNLNI